uniref:ZIP family metal transporter n=1 Tax=candidate division WOR-3 bacterium TaxID=2052148 RepID=A0A7C6ED12_UNCW3
MTLLLIIIATAAVSLISLVGVLFLGMKEKSLQKIIFALVSFATGALIGGALLHLLPESLSMGNRAFFHLIIGILFFFLTEKFLYWRHCHKGICDVHTFTYLNLIGDGVHNFIDGVIIAASFIVDLKLGLTTSIAVALHEIPQELGDFGILVYGGFSIKRALFFNLLSAITCLVGGIANYFLSSFTQLFKVPLLAFSAGGFLYIALVDLLPELRAKASLKESLAQLIFILLGIGLMFGLKVVFAEG